jgi:SAM-dependent methyltransferase
MEKFETDMYDRKYSNKDEARPRSVVSYFVDTYLTRSKNCLDLGSGAGRHSKYIAGKGIDVTAIDLSEIGVEKTKEVLKDFPNSKVLIGDIHNLPFEDQSFDSLICNRALDYNDDSGLEIAFTEIERVVKNGGIVLITVRSISQQPKLEEILITENSEHAKSFKVADSTQVQHYFTEQEIQALAKKHNFDVVEIREDKHVNSENESKAEWQVILKKLR